MTSGAASPSDWAGVTPDIAIVQRGTPAGFPDNAGVCSFRWKAEIAKAAGAKAVIVYNNVPGLLNGTAGDPPLDFGVVGTTPELGEDLLAQLGQGAGGHALQVRHRPARR